MEAKNQIDIEKKYNCQIKYELSNGYSGALNYKIEIDNETYFLKILTTNVEAAERSLKLSYLYQKSHIRIHKLINIEKCNNYLLIIYSWNNGVALNHLLKQDEHAGFFYFQNGIIIGTWINNMMNIHPKELSSYKDYVYKLKIRIKDLLVAFDKIAKKLNPYYDKLIDFILAYTNSITNKNICFVHGDIKLGNIMVDDAGLEMVDLEGTRFDFSFTNYRYLLEEFLFSRNRYKIFSFMQGLCNGISFKNRQQLENDMMFNLCYIIIDYQIKMYHSSINDVRSRIVNSCGDFLCNTHLDFKDNFEEILIEWIKAL